MNTIPFLTPEISQGELATFCDERVNLKRERADEYRDQINKLREHLDRYIQEHPDIGLEKMMLSGSLAKGTALSTIRDIDVAVYVKGDAVPEDLEELLKWLVDRLRTTYFQIDSSKIYIDGPCVVIEYSKTGINAEVAPIYSLGGVEGRGYLWDRATGKRTLTSIPQHLKFIRKRKDAQPIHLAQVIRLLKWWVQQRLIDTQNFRFRSFLVELLVSKLSDDGAKFDDYHSGLETFFTYIQNTELKSRISFCDYYPASKLPKTSIGAVEIFDPINPENNVAADLSDSDRKILVGLSEKALDALTYARSCQTKRDAIECWQELMGASFNF
jgi:tRNA nucleotidyltransferase (CCA-adding enzyme)